MEVTASPTITNLGNGYQLHQSQQFNRSIEETFEFFSDPENLERITPPRLHFSVENCEPTPVREGTTIDYRLTLRGFPIRWTSRIKDYQPNQHFTDEMVRGPYRTWEHVHTFESVRGRTVVGDQVYYELPYGWVGELAHRLFVKRDLKAIFEYRAKKLAEIFREDD